MTKRSVAGPAHADDLLAASGRGDLRAFGAFYDRTVPLIFGLLHRSLGDARRTWEATERVYVRLWREAPRFPGRGESAYGLLLAATQSELDG